MNTDMIADMIEILKKEYNGRFIEQTETETIVYIDDIMILDNLFNSQEKERHEYNKMRLTSRLNDLDYEENTLIGRLIIIKIPNVVNDGKCSFTISPPCSKLVRRLKNLNL